MHKMFRLAGVAAIGLGLGVGCGGALADVSEVSHPGPEGVLFRALSLNGPELGELAGVKALDEPRREEVRREEVRREEPRGEEHPREEVDTPPHGDELPGPVSVVPEPGAWAMMILGMAFLGLCVRRRTRREKA
jgi:PEP-CTERM motif